MPKVDTSYSGGSAWQVYGKSIAAALVVVAAAVQAAVSDSATGGRLTQIESVQIAIAVALKNAGSSALSMALSVASLINGPILGVFLVGAFLKRANQVHALAGMIVSILVMTYVLLASNKFVPGPVIANETIDINDGGVSGVVQGGMLMTFADRALGMTASSAHLLRS